MKGWTINLVGALCAVALCLSPALAAETLRVGGGSAPMENIFKRIKEPFEKKTGIVLELHENGPIDAWIDVMHDRLDVASSGLGSLKQWQEMVEKSGKEGAATQGKLIWHLIGNDFVTAYTHKDVPVSTLTTEQVKKIFTGQITNWRELDGGNLPIVVVLGNNVAGLMSEFQKKVLDGAGFAANAVYVDSANDMKEKVVGTPGAVSIGTLAQTTDERINVIDYPAPRRRISMMWKSGSPKRQLVQTLYEYIATGEGVNYALTQLQDKKK